MNLHPINGTTTVYSNDRVTEHKVFKDGMLMYHYRIDEFANGWSVWVNGWIWQEPFRSNREAYLWIIDNDVENLDIR
jgi:hypothetical protein